VKFICTLQSRRVRTVYRTTGCALRTCVVCGAWGAGSKVESRGGARGPDASRSRAALSEADPDETKFMTVAWPHHACVPLSKRRHHHLARSTCRVRLHPTCAPRHSAPTREQVQEQLCRRALHARADDRAREHVAAGRASWPCGRIARWSCSRRLGREVPRWWSWLRLDRTF
jgi:hypothetical protein